MKTNVHFIAVTLVILMTAACQKNEPDWNALAYQALIAQGSYPHTRLLGVDQCRPRVQGDSATVRCQASVELLTGLADLQARHGSAEESITVAEMTHRFGDFDAGSHKVLPVTLRFNRQGRSWQPQP